MNTDYYACEKKRYDVLEIHSAMWGESSSINSIEEEYTMQGISRWEIMAHLYSWAKDEMVSNELGFRIPLWK